MLGDVVWTFKHYKKRCSNAIITSCAVSNWDFYKVFYDLI